MNNSATELPTETMRAAGRSLKATGRWLRALDVIALLDLMMKSRLRVCKKSSSFIDGVKLVVNRNATRLVVGGILLGFAALVLSGQTFASALLLGTCGTTLTWSVVAIAVQMLASSFSKATFAACSWVATLSLYLTLLAAPVFLLLQIFKL